jgi:hypothetical protein
MSNGFLNRVWEVRVLPDKRVGALYLGELVGLMDRPPIVIACGNVAHAACYSRGLEAINICHPSNRGLHGQGGKTAEDAHVAGLRLAARRLRAACG